MKILLFGALLLWFMQPVYTFWWWFSSDIVEKENFSKEDSSIQTVKNVFAPFEVSIVEQKFLQEANTYLSNLPMLDQCNLLVSLSFVSVLLIHSMKRGVRFPLQFRSPSNSGLQGPPFQLLNISVQKV